MATEAGHHLPKANYSRADGVGIWPILVAVQAGLCVAGTGVLQHSATLLLCGGVVTAAVAFLLGVQVLAIRYQEQVVAMLTGGIAALTAALATLAMIAATGLVLLELLITLALDGSAWLDGGPRPALLVPEIALLAIGSCCSIVATSGSARVTGILWMRVRQQRKGSDTT